MYILLYKDMIILVRWNIDVLSYLLVYPSGYPC